MISAINLLQNYFGENIYWKNRHLKIKYKVEGLLYFTRINIFIEYESKKRERKKVLQTDIKKLELIQLINYAVKYKLYNCNCILWSGSVCNTDLEELKKANENNYY